MDEAISMQSVVVVTNDKLWRQFDREVAILNLRNETYYGLDRVGAYVWTLMQQPSSVTWLRNAMLERYDVDEQRCERELLELLETLRAEGLIEVQSAGSS